MELIGSTYNDLHKSTHDAIVLRAGDVSMQQASDIITAVNAAVRTRSPEVGGVPVWIWFDGVDTVKTWFLASFTSDGDLARMKEIVKSVPELTGVREMSVDYALRTGKKKVKVNRSEKKIVYPETEKKGLGVMDVPPGLRFFMCDEAREEGRKFARKFIEYNLSATRDRTKELIDYFLKDIWHLYPHIVELDKFFGGQIREAVEIFGSHHRDMKPWDLLSPFRDIDSCDLLNLEKHLKNMKSKIGSANEKATEYNEETMHAEFSTTKAWGRNDLDSQGYYAAKVLKGKTIKSSIASR